MAQGCALRKFPVPSRTRRYAPGVPPGGCFFASFFAQAKKRFSTAEWLVKKAPAASGAICPARENQPVRPLTRLFGQSGVSSRPFNRNEHAQATGFVAPHPNPSPAGRGAWIARGRTVPAGDACACGRTHSRKDRSSQSTVHAHRLHTHAQMHAHTHPACISQDRRQPERADSLPTHLPSHRKKKPHRPGSSFHSSLCSCIWNRTGSRSSTIQSASSRGSNSALLGENSTSQRSARRCSASMPRAHS